METDGDITGGPTEVSGHVSRLVWRSHGGCVIRERRGTLVPEAGRWTSNGLAVSVTGMRFQARPLFVHTFWLHSNVHTKNAKMAAAGPLLPAGIWGTLHWGTLSRHDWPTWHILVGLKPGSASTSAIIGGTTTWSSPSDHMTRLTRTVPYPTIHTIPETLFLSDIWDSVCRCLYFLNAFRKSVCIVCSFCLRAAQQSSSPVSAQGRWISSWHHPALPGPAGRGARWHHPCLCAPHFSVLGKDPAEHRPGPTVH